MELERLKAGDERALAALLDDVWRPLVRYVHALSGDAAAAEDAAQEAFVRLWEHRERWEAGTARGLLFRIARNVLRDRQRRAEVRRRREGEVRAHGSRPRTPAEELQEAEVAERVREALAALPGRRREVFELVRFHGLTYAETADVLEISEQTVANQVSRALRELRRQLDGILDQRAGEGGTEGQDHG